MSLTPFLGRHPSVRELLRLVERAAPRRFPVLVSGETGTGKEIIARRLHEQSGRRGAFVAINVAALPEGLAEAELFGVRRGAFTGATEHRAGLFEQAHGGTLYLDEASELSLTMQARLLRVLESGAVRSVGAVADRLVDVRVVLSTQRPPGELTQHGRWRLDFYHRTADVVLEIPPLRRRQSDIALLAASFLAEEGMSHGLADARPLSGYHWPANVRELQRAVRRAVFLAEGAALDADVILDAALQAAVEADTASTSRIHARRSLSRHDIQDALRRAEGRVAQAARLLGMSRSSLYRLLRVRDIPTPVRASPVRLESTEPWDWDEGTKDRTGTTGARCKSLPDNGADAASDGHAT